MGSGTRALISRRPLLFISASLTWLGALIFWHIQPFTTSAQQVPIATAVICGLLLTFLIWLRLNTTKAFWLTVWGYGTPWLLTSIVLFPQVPQVIIIPILISFWLVLGFWGYYRYYPLTLDTRLHRARFAREDEKELLLHRNPDPASLLLGVNLLGYFLHWYPLNRFFCVRSIKTKRELGNMLLVAPTRSGKGLLAVTQLLTWKESCVVNDLKGELYHATSGYRSTLGKVIVIDPTEGVGNRFDPLQGKVTEDDLLSAATQLLFVPDEGNGIIFTQRAIVMLTQIFLAARKSNHPPFLFTHHLITQGLPEAARILHNISPKLATRFLDVSYTKADFSDRFLHSAWSTLTNRLGQLLTQQLLRTLAGSDIDPSELLLAERPVTLYLRWKEEHLLKLAPMVRLAWNSLLNTLITCFDKRDGKGCRQVLMLIDEAGRTAIPSLADYASTVVGRGIYLWIAVQSLSQLDAVYGKERAQALKDNCEHQLYYRQNDLSTAEYLSRRTGSRSAYAHSFHTREAANQGNNSQGLAEQGIPLLTPQDIMQLRDEKIIAFHRRLPPIKMQRIDWRRYPHFRQKRQIPAPPVSELPPVAEIPIGTPPPPALATLPAYVNPDVYQQSDRRTMMERDSQE